MAQRSHHGGVEQGATNIDAGASVAALAWLVGAGVDALVTDTPRNWLADVPQEALGLRRLVRLAKGRWRIEEDYRELKDELGLDHFEGRSWPGWHHHVTLASMAYAFLVFETLRARKKNGGRDAARRAARAASAADSTRPVVPNLSAPLA